MMAAARIQCASLTLIANRYQTGLYQTGLCQTGIATLLPRRQFHLNDLATHLLDALLLTEPVIVGHEFREKSILQFPLGANPSLAWHAGSHLEHSHDLFSPNWQPRQAYCLLKWSQLYIENAGSHMVESQTS
jgi:hypothetical protein